MTPEVAAHRLACSLAMGMVLGLLFGFLRPLGRKHRTLADGIFLLAALWCWVYLMFAVCRGDIRFGYFLALVAGAVFWEATAGRTLRPVFLAIWRILAGVFHTSLFPVKNFTNSENFCLHLWENGLQ